MISHWLDELWNVNLWHLSMLDVSEVQIAKLTHLCGALWTILKPSYFFLVTQEDPIFFYYVFEHFFTQLSMHRNWKI